MDMNKRNPYYIRNLKLRIKIKEPEFDPRLPISQHLLWQKSSQAITEYTTPEPSNYNRALIADQPIECKFIQDQVFYRDLKTNKWFTVYYVPPAQITEFDLWIIEQDFLFRWYHPQPPEIKIHRKLLHSRHNGELTANERLFGMGYYAKLTSKYFSDNDTMLLERLGPARAEAYKVFDEV